MAGRNICQTTSQRNGQRSDRSSRGFASEPSAVSPRGFGCRCFDDEADRRERDSQEAGSGKSSVVLQRPCRGNSVESSLPGQCKDLRTGPDHGITVFAPEPYLRQFSAQFRAGTHGAGDHSGTRRSVLNAVTDDLFPGPKIARRVRTGTDLANISQENIQKKVVFTRF